MFNNWIGLDDDDIRLEYNVEYKYHVLYKFGNVFPSFVYFKNLVKKHQKNPVDINLNDNIHNFSRCTSIDKIIELIHTYRSYPEFKNEKTVQDIIEGFLKNKPMKMPILIEKNEEYHVMSGNTRMNIAFILNIPIKAIIIKLNTIAC